MSLRLQHEEVRDAPLGAEQPVVAFRRVLSRRQRVLLAVVIAVDLLVAIGFVVWLALPSHLPLAADSRGPLVTVLGLAGFGALLVLELTRAAQSATLWLFAWKMRDPVPMLPEPGLRVAVLTTIVPSKEPLALVEETLAAMRNIRYHGQVDVWILDEGNDPAVRRMAAKLGVKHFSRHGLPEYNQPSGPFRARTKAGNHNAWRAEHERDYDIVAQMDPDHVPFPSLLARTLGYFRDPDVAFVVAPQVYGNRDDSFIVGAADDQSFVFHGVVQRGGNGLGAPLLIGTNHLYRTSAWRQIDGYQDSVIEDHLTSLTVNGSENPETGNRWKGIYTPEIVAVGEGPRSWTDYFNQQQRWAYGIWEVILKHAWRKLWRLSWSQRLSYLALELFYPSVAVIWVLGSLLTALYLILGVTVIDLPLRTWAIFWLATFFTQYGTFLWLRRFNLQAHERAGSGLNGMLLSIAAGPVYVAAAAAALCRRPLSYVVTAKSDLVSSDSLATFRSHFSWAVFAAVMLVASLLMGHNHWPLRAWALVTLAAVVAPVAAHLSGRLTRRAARPRLALASAALAAVLVVPMVAGATVLWGNRLLDGAAEQEAAVIGIQPPAGNVGQHPAAPAAGQGHPSEPGSAVIARPTPPKLLVPGRGDAPVMFGIFDQQTGPQTGDIAAVYYQWTAQPENFARFVQGQAQAGRTALITWEPRSGEIQATPTAHDTDLLLEIASGRQDAYITSVADALAATKQPVIIRFAEEMDLATSGLHPWAGHPPAIYVAAYQRMVTLFRAAGADNVLWLWTPSAMTDAQGNLTSMPYYPGDAYVDYTGFDAFLYWRWEEWNPQRQAARAYRSPDEYLTRPIQQLAALGKPVIIPELGVDLGSDRSAAKQRWIEQAGNLMAQGHYPGLAAVVYFDAQHNWDDRQADWRLSPDDSQSFLVPFQRAASGMPAGPTGPPLRPR